MVQLPVTLGISRQRALCFPETSLVPGTNRIHLSAGLLKIPSSLALAACPQTEQIHLASLPLGRKRQYLNPSALQLIYPK